jgi:hypothetical protein
LEGIHREEYMRSVRAALAVMAALTLCFGIGVPAAGAAERQESPAAAAAHESGAKHRPVARAACPLCVVGAVAVVRAAVAVRAAATAPTIVSAGLAARAAAGTVLARVTRATVRRVQQSARTVSRRGKDWVRANWGRLKPQVQACLATIAFMESKGFLEDRLITRREWSIYATFGPRLVAPTETLSINFPLRFDAGKLASEAANEAIECAVGIGAARYFEKS